MHSPTVSPELLQPFSPFQALAQELLPLTLEGDDGSHDVAHLHRVWKNCRQISQDEGETSKFCVPPCCCMTALQ